MRSKIKPYLLRIFALVLFLTLSSPGVSYSSYIEDLKTRGMTFYLIHDFSSDSADTAADPTALPDLPAKCRLLSQLPKGQDLFPIADSEQIVKNIVTHSESLEKSRDDDEKQILQLNLAYEYYLLFLYFQKEKFSFENSESDESSVRLEELHQYLLLADKYMTSAVGKPTQEMIQSVEKAGPSNAYQAIGVNFNLRGNSAHLFNSGFLQFVIECEKMAGEWQFSSTNERLQFLDFSTWQWLDNLWGLYAGNPAKRTGYLDPGVLFSVHDLYLRYHFLSQFLQNPQQPDIYSNFIDQKLLERLNRLQADAGYSYSPFYSAYLAELRADGGDTTLLHSLYLARRWPAFLDAAQGDLPKMAIFQLYQPLFEEAIGKTFNSIPYRSRIYNELVIFGTNLGHPGVMEDALYDLALRSMSLERDPEILGKAIEDSARLTMTYLLSHMLQLKWKSGIDYNIGKYEDMAENLSAEIVATRPDLWRYASAMHQVFAEYYAKANDLNSREKALYHAKEAFAAPCRYLKAENLDWQHFYDDAFAEDASLYLKKFIVYKNKYSIRDMEEVLPIDLENSKLIVQKYIKE